MTRGGPVTHSWAAIASGPGKVEGDVDVSKPLPHRMKKPAVDSSEQGQIPAGPANGTSGATVLKNGTNSRRNALVLDGTDNRRNAPNNGSNSRRNAHVNGTSNNRNAPVHGNNSRRDAPVRTNNRHGPPNKPGARRNEHATRHVSTMDAGKGRNEPNKPVSRPNENSVRNNDNNGTKGKTHKRRGNNFAYAHGKNGKRTGGRFGRHGVRVNNNTRAPASGPPMPTVPNSAAHGAPEATHTKISDTATVLANNLNANDNVGLLETSNKTAAFHERLGSGCMIDPVYTTNYPATTTRPRGITIAIPYALQTKARGGNAY
ncbi:hypothetical protein V8F20_012316 [Naviculisporaceae sp. PSN 640]